MKTYKGFEYHQPGATTTVRYDRVGAWVERTVQVYEIVGLKEAGKRPFLTTEQQVRDYINSHLEGIPMMKAEAPQRIRSARTRMGMTQVELGTAMGYTVDTAGTTVARWEAGTRPVPMGKIKALADLLHINPLDLMP